MRILRVACIGSREISEETSKLMEEIGKFIVEKGWYIASGNALGSDAAYVRGGNKVNPKNVILYLPWKKYNEELIVSGNRVTWESRPEWQKVAKQHHSGWDKLSQGGKSLMTRNAGILSRADKCIAFLNPNKTWGGGTAHGWNISKTMAIPRFPLKDGDRIEAVKIFLTHGV